MQSHRAIPVLRTIINDLMELYLALKGEDIDMARYWAAKISADMRRITDFIKEGEIVT